jgi:hypothetical protein
MPCQIWIPLLWIAFHALPYTETSAVPLRAQNKEDTSPAGREPNSQSAAARSGSDGLEANHAGGGHVRAESAQIQPPAGPGLAQSKSALLNHESGAPRHFRSDCQRILNHGPCCRTFSLQDHFAT